MLFATCLLLKCQKGKVSSEMTEGKGIASLGISRALDCCLFAFVNECLSEHKRPAEGFHYLTQKDLLPYRETEGHSQGGLVLLER